MTMFGKPAHFSLAAVFLFAASALAQPSPLDPPLAGRPTNYSQLVGRFTIEAKVEPLEALVEDPLTLRVVLQGDIAAGEPPTRKSLRLFTDDFAESFFLEPVPEKDRLRPAEKTWEFIWKLRPKSTDVRELPSLVLAFYSPQVRRYQTVRSEPIVLVIQSRPKVIVESNEWQPAPESFLDWAARSEAPSPWRVRSPLPMSGAEWIVLAMIFAILSWRRGGALLKRATAELLAQRSRLSANAVAELRREPADPAAIVTRFLHARFGLATVEPSSADIGAVLKRNGIAAAIRERWANWYRAASEKRFAPPTAVPAFDRRLIDDAIALIQSVEAKP